MVCAACGRCGQGVQASALGAPAEQGQRQTTKAKAPERYCRTQQYLLDKVCCVAEGLEACGTKTNSISSMEKITSAFRHVNSSIGGRRSICKCYSVHVLQQL